LIFLDSNICIYVMRRMSDSLVAKFERETHQLHVSTVVVAELEYGVTNSTNKSANALKLEQFLSQIKIASWDHACARSYADVRFALKSQPISTEDTMIAACALAHQSMIVTNNVREFSRVPGLRVENWLAQYG
jgi:tRNA(fMet)-specific endonuclease VapC